MSNNQNNPRKIKMFKVLIGYDKKDLKNMPVEIPWAMLNEEQARFNHSQTLTRLNERGGMCVTEILANIYKQSKRDWTVTQETVDELNKLVDDFLNPQEVPQVKSVEEASDWTESGGTINVPDHLMPLFNKIGTQIRFHTISGKNENLTIAHIIRISELSFQSRIAELEKKNAEYEQALIRVKLNLPPVAEELNYIGMGTHYRNCLALINEAEQALNNKDK